MWRWLADRFMKELGLVSCQQPTHRYKHGGHEHVAIPNYLERLLRLITHPEWLAEAARITLSSTGAHPPGVDGVNKATLQARLAAELQILRDELFSGDYQPLPPTTASSVAKSCTDWWGKARSCSAGVSLKVTLT